MPQLQQQLNKKMFIVILPKDVAIRLREKTTSDYIKMYTLYTFPELTNDGSIQCTEKFTLQSDKQLVKQQTKFISNKIACILSPSICLNTI